jgi:hypothetical protein
VPAQLLSFKPMVEGGSSERIVPVIDHEDYYIDHGLMVFTARYLLRRGYCCEQGCRHCPYTKTGKGNCKPEVEDNETTK